jgi:peptidoglycan/LPS O-acetylase OafA/YrhL
MPDRFLKHSLPDGSATRTAHFDVLDSFRGLCAGLVMLFHLDARTHFQTWPLIRNGAIAVDFFFVLSGFIIASAYGKALADDKRFLRFAVRRIGRLYPLHVSVLLFYIVVEAIAAWSGDTSAFTDNYDLPSLAANFFLLQGFVTGWSLSWNYPAWSISIELWTNLAFSLYVCWSGRRSLLVTAALFVLFLVFGMLAGALHLPFSVAPAVPGFVSRAVAEFLAGVLILSAYTHIRQTDWRPGWVVEGLSLALVALGFEFANRLPGFLILPIFCTAVLVFAFETGPISRQLRAPALTGLGTISYSVYLTHSVYLMVFTSAAEATGRALGLADSAVENANGTLIIGGPWTLDLAAVLCVGVALLGSSLTYRFIEEPMRRYFNGLSDRRITPGRQSAPALQPECLPPKKDSV